MNAKEILRGELRNIRSNMQPEAVVSLSDAITSQLITLVDWSQVRRIHYYTARSSWREVDTEKLLEHIRTRHPAVECIQVAQSSRAAIPTGVFDLIIVPLLAFDEQKNRLGQGSGWYDRFLASQSNALKIGLAFEYQKVNQVPSEAHDMPLSYIVTETTVY